MTDITKEQYEYAEARIEELLPLVDDDTPANDKNLLELTIMSDIVMRYEAEHYPIEKPTIGELISWSLEDLGLSKRELAAKIGISPSRISDFVSGRSKPSLDIARLLCQSLNIPPAEMLGL